MITKFKIYENYNVINVDYKIIKNSNEIPTVLVSDYKFLNSDNDEVEVIAKGYEYVDGGWVEFNDFESEKTHIFNKVCFEDGTKKIKVDEE